MLATVRAVLHPTSPSLMRLVSGECGVYNKRRVYLFFHWSGQHWPLGALLGLGDSLVSTPLCHTYSEPSGHEDSPGTTFNIPYLFKKLSKSRLSDRFFGLFLVISEVLYSENSNFQDFSVLGENYVFYHLVCHRYS